MIVKLSAETVNQFVERMAEAHRLQTYAWETTNVGHSAIAICQCETARAYRRGMADPRYQHKKQGPPTRKTFYLTLLNDNNPDSPLPSGFVGTSEFPEIPSQLHMKIRLLEAMVESLGYGIRWTETKPSMAQGQSDEYLEVE